MQIVHHSWQGLVYAAVSVVWLVLSCSPAKAAQTGDTELAQLLQCALPLESENGRRLSLELSQNSPGQPETRLYALLDVDVRDELKRMRLKMSAPSDVKGTSYLFAEQAGKRQMYMYLPAMKRSQQLSPESRVQLMGTQLEVRSLFALLLGGSQMAITGGRELQREGRSLRRVHVTGFDGDQALASSLLIDRQSCQMLELKNADGVSVDLRYANHQARWPDSLHIRSAQHGGNSVLKILSQEPLPDGSSFGPENYYR